MPEGQRETCPFCGKSVGVRLPRFGDGSYVYLNWHREKRDPSNPIVPRECEGRFHSVPNNA